MKISSLTLKYRLGLGKLRNHTGGPGGLPPGLGLGQLRNQMGVAKKLKSTFIESWSAAAC